jgi:hypothetical protein
MSITYRVFSDYWIEPGFWMLFIPLILIFFIVAIFVIPFKFFTRKPYSGWKFWLKYLLFFLVSMEFSAYFEEAYIRQGELNEKCKKEFSPDQIYIGEVCKLGYRTGSPGEGHVWLRVYDAKTLKLIKEGDGGFSWIDIYWIKNESGRTTAIYSDTTEDKYIMRLPPSWLDKIRAKLP